MAVQIDLTTLSGYESLPAGTYALGVKAKASGYTDSDLSSTVNFTKLAAPVATAADTTVSWDAITNAESYDVYVDGELYENTTGGATSYTLEAGTYKWVDTLSKNISELVFGFNFSVSNYSYVKLQTELYGENDFSLLYYYNDDEYETAYDSGSGWVPMGTSGDYIGQTITLSSPQTVPVDFYNWAITGGNLVKQTGETWLLNESIVSALGKTDINFKVKNSTTDYTGIRFALAFDSYNGYYYYDGTYLTVYESSWFNQDNRTLTFNQPVTDTNLLSWLQKNGTKQ